MSKCALSYIGISGHLLRFGVELNLRRVVKQARSLGLWETSHAHACGRARVINARGGAQRSHEGRRGCSRSNRVLQVRFHGHAAHGLALDTAVVVATQVLVVERVRARGLAPCHGAAPVGEVGHHAHRQAEFIVKEALRGLLAQADAQALALRGLEEAALLNDYSRAPRLARWVLPALRRGGPDEEGEEHGREHGHEFEPKSVVLQQLGLRREAPEDAEDAFCGRVRAVCEELLAHLHESLEGLARAPVEEGLRRLEARHPAHDHTEGGDHEQVEHVVGDGHAPALSASDW
mmetsp:Transcript_9402/g.25596  ORF Transcript_9402/g.25596 Transcript_9402/m.25596 type:complete len:291 (-) Transcript_9402:212-1084(-)